jgi:hypothetical protein
MLGFLKKYSPLHVRLIIAYKYRNLNRISRELEILGEKVISSISWNQGEFEFFTVNLFARNLHKVRSINLLLRSGLSADVWPLYRSLIESSLEYDYLVRCPEKLDIYYEYSIYLDIKKIERRRSAKKLSPEENALLTKLKVEWEKRKNKFQNRHGKLRESWRDVNLQEIAKQAGMEDVYLLGYREANDYVHSNSNLMVKFIAGKADDGLYLRVGPVVDRNDLNSLWPLTGLMYLHMLMLADDKFNLGLRNALVILRAAYLKASK